MKARDDGATAAATTRQWLALVVLALGLAIVIKQSFVDATRSAGLIANIFVMLGAISSLLIPTTVRRGAGTGAVARTVKKAGVAERIVHHGKIPVLMVHP